MENNVHIMCNPIPLDMKVGQKILLKMMRLLLKQNRKTKSDDWINLKLNLRIKMVAEDNNRKKKQLH